MNKRLRAAVFDRAGGVCECGCGRFLGDEGEIDHMFSRRVEESIQTLWAIHRDCHARKTVNDPSNAHWMRRFLLHAEWYGYDEGMIRCEVRLEVLKQKGITK